LVSSSSASKRSTRLRFGRWLATSFSGFVSRRTVLRVPMAEPAKPEVTEEAKMDLLEDDDEFEEFEINQEWDDKEEGNEALQQWEDDWDDDDVNDDFSLQLRKELESNASKN
ncbi:unnamed protein product, partial [Urochloa humidicola]